jgi:hypothetical protein
MKADLLVGSEEEEEEQEGHKVRDCGVREGWCAVPWREVCDKG